MEGTMNDSSATSVVVEMEEWRKTRLPEIIQEHWKFLFKQREVCIGKVSVGQRHNFAGLLDSSIERRVTRRIRALFENYHIAVKDESEAVIISASLAHIFSNLIRSPSMYREGLDVIAMGGGSPLKLHVASHACLLMAGAFCNPLQEDRQADFKKYTICAARYSRIILNNMTQNMKGVPPTIPFRRWIVVIKNAEYAGKIFGNLLYRSIYI